MELTDARRIMLLHNYTWYDLFYNTLQTPKMAICLNETTYHLKHNSLKEVLHLGESWIFAMPFRSLVLIVTCHCV